LARHTGRFSVNFECLPRQPGRRAKPLRAQAFNDIDDLVLGGHLAACPPAHGTWPKTLAYQYDTPSSPWAGLTRVPHDTARISDALSPPTRQIPA